MAEEIHPSTHPPLPPTTEDDRVSWLRLLRSRRVGPTTFHRLMKEHGTAQAALETLPQVASDAGMREYRICPEGVAVAELRAARKMKARMICIGDPDYPLALHDLSDAPPILWAMGQIDVLHRPMVAIVGARNASSLGVRMARALAHDLGKKGYVVVSGLARGIDAAAHKATLDTGTIAVQAGGVDIMYPSENTALAGDILTNGLRISEQPFGRVPHTRHFPIRNRLISGLASAVVLVEAAAKSGSIITARNALDQGREVLAVPGHPFDARSAGCNMLLRDGAHLVRSADDIIEAISTIAHPTVAQPPKRTIQTSQTPAKSTERRTLTETAALHSMILSRLGPSPVAEDQLIRDIATPANSVSPALVDLELDGKIIRQAGGLLSLAIPSKVN